MNKIRVWSLLITVVVFFALAVRAESAWTTSSCAPSEWTALDGNLLAGQVGVISGNIASGYSTNDPVLLTDCQVPRIAIADTVKTQIVGFTGNASVTWTFEGPKTLEQVRISCGYPVVGQHYSGSCIAKVEVMTYGSSDWTQLNDSYGEFPDNGGNEIQSQILADTQGGSLAEAVVALKVTFGSPYGLASYCGEIEAVGSAGAVGPLVASFDIAPAKTKATISGVIADVGTDATLCDVYLSLDGGEAVKIAENVTGAFSHPIQGLSPETTYAYTLCVSNNAPSSKVTVKSGEFTTLSASAATAVWAGAASQPQEWRALERNVLANRKGVMVFGAPNGYGTSDLSVLCDGNVPFEAGKDWIVGLAPNAEIAWDFPSPVSIEQLRISSSYLADPKYSGVNIAAVKVKYDESGEWVDIPGASSGSIVGDRTSGQIISATLSDAESAFLAQDIRALKVVFGAPVNANANYYAEIEAVGLITPAIDKVTIAPLKTVAEISGSLFSVGTGATSCNVYLALNDAKPVRIAKKVTEDFSYRIEGLTPGTTYAYTLSVSNNASIVLGDERRGEFTTMPADAQTASWVQDEYSTDVWTPLENNVLAGLTATEMTKFSSYASSDSAVLTDGLVPCPDPTSDGEAGKVTVGFGAGGATIAWAFDKPTSIEKIRLSSYWWQNLFNGISINAVEVKYTASDDWKKLDVPTVEWKGGTKLCQTQTLIDAENGFVAKKIVGLRLTFGGIKGGIANYYAEIEAVKYIPPKKFGFMLIVR